MLYSSLRALLFKCEPELAHQLALNGLDLAERLGAMGLAPAASGRPVTVMGIDFPNAVGLAAGLDKNAEHIDGLGALGFGFLEVGTVTPRPQPGNPRPRLFRIPEHDAIINRMGFNNQGVDYLLQQVENSRYDGVLGINIGKNVDTPVESATADYLYCLRRVYSRASYVTVNLSSPNTPGLRKLQYGDALNALLDALKTEQLRLAGFYGRYVPIAVKIAPDMTGDEVRTVAQALAEYRMDAVIATNTTLSREGVAGSSLAQEAGGLSGAPVRDASTRVIGELAAELQGRLPIIGVGGILSGQDAQAKIRAGASLVQLYTGFIYRGPALVREVVRTLAAVES